jgi:secreted trypsin-like serine protease
MIAPIRLNGPVTKDEALTVVGWGATETDFIPPGRMRRTDVKVVDVGPDPTPFVAGQLEANEFLASESVCTGDSGGPAFDATTHAVVGVVSRGPNGNITTNGSGCVGTQHVFMQTAPFKDLVLGAMATAGATPWLEGEPKPTVDAGAPSNGGGTSGEGDSGVGAAPSTVTTTSSGCSTGARVGAPDSSAIALGIALTLAAATRRRRRRRP